MKIPTDVDVLGIKYTIKETSSLGDGSRKFFGTCDMDLQEIQVLDSLKDDRKMETVQHELFHSLDDVVGLRLKEFQIDKLSMGLYAVYKNNPYLLLALVESTVGLDKLIQLSKEQDNNGDS